MSKVNRQNSGVVDGRAIAVASGLGGRVTRASSTSAAAAAAAAKISQGGKSIVEVNNHMDASSSSSLHELAQCKPIAPPPPSNAAAAAAAAVKKKRLALGNISNAEGLQLNPASLNNPQAAAAAPKDAKKYRFNGANIVNIASNVASNVMPSFGQRKTSSQLGLRPSIKSSSKENLTYQQQQIPIPPARKTSAVGVTAKKSSTTTTTATSESLTKMSSVSKSENDIKRQVDSLSLAVEVSSSSSSMSLTTPATTTNSSSSSSCSNDQKSVLQPERISSWEDIDMNDIGDEFTCADYASQIFKYYREREQSFLVRDYLASPTANINRQMRILLVDWMVEVQQQLEFNHEVLYLSVKLLDLYLTRQLVDKERLQLLAAASMFIACKFEERMPPVIEDFILVSDNAYARKDVIKMEIEILKTVRFDLGVPLSYTFLRRYSKCIRADMKFLTLARYILELSLQDYTFATALDSHKACAALYLAMKMAVSHETQVNKSHDAMSSPASMLYVSASNLTSTEWNSTLVHYTNAFVHNFAHLIQPMNSLVKNAASSKYRTIYRKYSHPVFFEVAKVPALSDYQVELIVDSNEMIH